MIIEFSGLPGAGKTTLENILLRALGRAGISLCTRSQAVAQHIQQRYAARYPKTMLRKGISGLYLFNLYRMSTQARLRAGIIRPAFDYKRNLPIKWLAEDALLINSSTNSNSTRALWLSEGFQQHLAAASVWCGPTAWQLTRQFPLNNEQRYIIHVEVPIPTALKRLKKRGVPKTWPVATRSHLTILHDFNLAIDYSMKQAMQTGATVLSITNNITVESLAEQAPSLISRILSDKVFE